MSLSLNEFRQHVDHYEPLPEEWFELHGQRSHYLLKNERRMWEMTQVLLKHLQANDHILDLGGYPGSFFRILSQSCPLPLKKTIGGLLFSDAFIHKMKQLDIDLTDVNLDPAHDGLPVGTSDQHYQIQELKPAQVIVASEILEHMINPMHLLKVAHNALAEKGLLLLTTPNLAWIRSRIILLRGDSPNTPLNEGITINTKGDWRPHVRIYTMAELHELLAEAGFTPLESRYLDMRTRDKEHWPYSWLYSYPPIRHGLLVLAQKNTYS
jgi:hypothetical protein